MKQRISNTIITLSIILVLTSCSTNANNNTIKFTFNEGSGSSVSSNNTNHEDYEIDYLYNKATFKENSDPIWSTYGIDGAALLLDGNSTVIKVPSEDLPDYQEDLSISLWFAPRAFEWDDPNAFANNNAVITGLLSHSNNTQTEGFLLGYQRFGRLAFSIGTGESSHTLWADDDRLELHSWNHVGASYSSSTGEMSLFLNGELIASKTLEKDKVIVKPEKGNLLIGRNSKENRMGFSYLQSAAGLIDDVQISSNNNDWISAEYTDNSDSIPEIPFEEIGLQDILRDDIYRPAFHAQPPQNWMNEPHAPLFHNGKYHLFFQQNQIGPYWRNINWGHWVSDDLVDWEYLPEAIIPTENSVVPDGVWSGGHAKDVNDVPLLFFTAGNDNYAKEGLLSNQNIGVAYPKDPNDPNLIDWVISDELAIIQEQGMGVNGEFRDPHIWYEGDRWNMLLTSASSQGNGGTALLFQTSTLELDGESIQMDWEYRGPIYEMDNPSISYGVTWELPIIMPLENETGIKKHIFIFSPAPANIADNSIFYMLGEFDVDAGTFTPDDEYENLPRKFDYGANVFTGPSAFYDEISDKIYLFSIMQGQRSTAHDTGAGWAHTAGLTRELKLNADGDDILMSPVSSLSNIYDEEIISGENLTVSEINNTLADFSGNQYVLNLIVDTEQNAFDELSIRFLFGGARDESSIRYSKQNNEISATTKNPGSDAPLPHVSGPLTVDGNIHIQLIVDRSLIESYFNEERSISMRAYPEDAESNKLQIDALDDFVIESFKLHTLNEIG